MVGQKGENAAGDPGVEPEGLQSGDDAVAAERCAEPRHTGKGIGAVLCFGGQHEKIGGRAAEPVVELFVGGKDGRSPLFLLRLEVPHRIQGLAVSGDRGRPAAAFAGNDDGDVMPSPGGQIDVIVGPPVITVCRRRELDAGGAAHVVEAAVAEEQLAVTPFGGEDGAVLLPLHAAHLKDVRKVGRMEEGEPQTDGTRAVIVQADVLVAGVLPENDGAEDVHHPLGQEKTALKEEVRRGEIHGQGGVVL